MISMPSTKARSPSDWRCVTMRFSARMRLRASWMIQRCGRSCLGPGLHVPVTRVVERRVLRVQVEAGLPAFEQRFELARLLAGQ